MVTPSCQRVFCLVFFLFIQIFTFGFPQVSKSVSILRSTMATPEVDPDCQVKMTAFTKKNYRDVYPAVDPSRPDISQAGKVAVITGASRGLGRLVSTCAMV